MGCAPIKAKKSAAIVKPYPVERDTSEGSLTSQNGNFKAVGRNNSVTSSATATTSTIQTRDNDRAWGIKLVDISHDTYATAESGDEITPIRSFKEKYDLHVDTGVHASSGRIQTFTHLETLLESPGRVSGNTPCNGSVHDDDESYEEIERISSFVHYNSMEAKQAASRMDSGISRDDTFERALPFRMNTDQIISNEGVIDSIEFSRTDTFDHASPDFSPEKRARHNAGYRRDKSFTHIPEDLAAEETYGSETINAHSAFSLPTQYFFLDNENKADMTVKLSIPTDYDVFPVLEHEGVEVSRCAMMTSAEEIRTIKCRFPEAGEYQLNIQAKHRRTREQNLSVVATYFIENCSKHTGCAQYPEIIAVDFSGKQVVMDHDFSQGIEIVSPLSRDLKVGQSYEVSIFAPELESIKIISHGGAVKEKMTRRGDFFVSKLVPESTDSQVKLVWSSESTRALAMVVYNVEA